MNKVLVVVDMQNDFITGTLGTPEAQAIVPNVVAKIQQEAAAGTLLALTQDTHTEDYLETNEGKHLPVTHCIKNSVGWKLESSVIDSFKKVWDTYEIPKMIRITKPSFGSETLMENLAEDICDFTGSERDFGKGVEIEFVGAFAPVSASCPTQSLLKHGFPKPPSRSMPPAAPVLLRSPTIPPLPPCSSARLRSRTRAKNPGANNPLL